MTEVTNAAENAPDDAADDADRPSLREETWETLVKSVRKKTCTPFLGAGVSVPHLPRGSQLAVTLAPEYEYPLPDTTNLARVSQYIGARIWPTSASRQRSSRQFARFWTR